MGLPGEEWNSVCPPCLPGFGQRVSAMLSALFKARQPVSTPPMYRLLAAASLALLLTSCWKAESLTRAGLSPVLLHEPVQIPFRQPAFQTQVGGIEYTVQPLYRYELAGLVVSRHDSKAWWDYAHAEWKD